MTGKTSAFNASFTPPKWVSEKWPDLGRRTKPQVDGLKIFDVRITGYSLRVKVTSAFKASFTPPKLVYEKWPDLRADYGPTFTQRKWLMDPLRPCGPSLRPPQGPDVHLPKTVTFC